MDQLKIVGWTDFECEYPTVKLTQEELMNVLRLIQKEIIENNYIFAGEDHQQRMTGVPVFSDGTCFRASMRAWGNIMASIYSGPNGKELTYMDFYMSFGEDVRMPEYELIDVEPCTDFEESCGCTIREDKKIIDEAIAFDMPFITFDKVLNKLYDKLKSDKENEV